MARIIEGGEPVNDSERLAIDHLRTHAPDSWTVLHNIEVPARDGAFEVDLVVITHGDVYVIDVKGIGGSVEVIRGRWHTRRQSFRSPAAKLRMHAKVVKGRLVEQDIRLRRVHVASRVALTGSNVEIRDSVGLDSTDIVTLADLIPALGRPRRDGGIDATTVAEAIADALLGPVGGTRPPRLFGSWRVTEWLGGTDEVTEYRAANASAPAAAGTVHLQAHRADPYAPEDIRDQQRLRISNAYEALGRVPPHSAVVGVRDFFPDGDQYVLVLDDPQGRALRAVLADRDTPPLSLDIKLRLIRDIAAGLAHVHQYGVLHRALNPDNIVVAADGRALLTGFGYAKPGLPRTESVTVEPEIPEIADPLYVAPEARPDSGAFTAAADVYSLGTVAYELVAGKPPVPSVTERHADDGADVAERLRQAGASERLVDLVSSCCSVDPVDRPCAEDALADLQLLLRGGPPAHPPPGGGSGSGSGEDSEPDWFNLPADYPLEIRYTVLKRLGKPGGFAVAYKVYDTFDDATRVLKLVVRDMHSLIDRFLREYKTLHGLPDHPNIVKPLYAGTLRAAADKVFPFLVFDYVDTRAVSELVDERLLGPADVRTLGIDVATGLVHIHAHQVRHCDIKPGNLLWTESGARIIDFNVAVTASGQASGIGGSTRYQPPDSDSGSLTTDALVDRDVYGLGLTMYEALLGGHPWAPHDPPVGEYAPPIRAQPGLHQLAPEFAEIIDRCVHPVRAHRFVDAAELLDALNRVTAMSPPVARSDIPVPRPPSGCTTENQFLVHLQTLYSQSRRSNRGTRGKDSGPTPIYVESKMDGRLIDDVLDGKHRLVVITGNAGDGKTAFLENLVAVANDRQARLEQHRVNGTDFVLGTRRFRVNNDGSQDEGEQDNTEVLTEFFGPYGGTDPTAWPEHETRLIAINEGRLIDFLTAHDETFQALIKAVQSGLAGEQTPTGVVVVNLNRRSVVAEPDTDGLESSLFDRMIERMTAPQFWDACGSCEIADRCYARHNARTFAHPTAKRHVIERLRTLYTLTHLRGDLHITLRDLRSALAFTLASGRDCSQIKSLYSDGDAEAILRGFYFTSWMGEPDTSDRLLTLLREVDVANVPAPALDRRLARIGPAAGLLMTVDQRGNYDEELLRHKHTSLDWSTAGTVRQDEHREYLAAARRRHFFESADADAWRAALPYRSAGRFLALLRGEAPIDEQLTRIVGAVNRDEGLADPRRLGDALVLQVREVPGGTIRAYRMFPLERFSLMVKKAPDSPYLESAADALALRYSDDDSGTHAELMIRLDLFEMLHRLRQGVLPAKRDLEGRYLSLAVFKNRLAAAPYQEILLTTATQRQDRIRRVDDGTLHLLADPGKE